MPIDPSIADLPWLAQGGYDSRPLAAGAAVGAHVAAQRMANASLAQRAQEFQAEQGMRERQLAVELAQAPLQQTLLQQKAQTGALNLELALKAKQDDIEATGAFAGLVNRVSPLLQTGKLDNAIVAHADAGLNHNALLTDQRYLNLGKQLDVMRKEADLAEYRKNSTDARLKAATGTEFRSLPPGVKIDRLLQSAQADLIEAQDPETGDPSLIPHFQQVVQSLQEQKQLAFDKLKNEQGKVTNESDRIKANRERTAAIQARTLELGNRLNKGDLSLMNQKIKVIQDQPNSKMDFAAKMKAIDDIHTEFEAKTRTHSAPGGGPAASTPAQPGQFRLGATYRKPNGKAYIYKGGDANDAASWQEAL